MSFRRFIVSLLFLSFSLCFWAEDMDKNHIKMLYKYDVAEFFAYGFKPSTELYWQTVQKNNIGFNEAFNAVQNNKAREVKEAFSEIAHYCKIYSETFPILVDKQYIADSLLCCLGVSSLLKDANVRFVDDSQINALTSPFGDIMIFRGLAERLNWNFELLLGVAAHEMTHYILQHSFCELYEKSKKEKKSKLLADLAGAIVVSAGVASDLYAASNGVNTNSASTEAGYLLWNESRKTASEYLKSFMSKYSKEMEYEADIVAYRFLQYCGYSPSSYIDMLKLIKSDYEEFSSSGTHPLTKDRISLLENIDDLAIKAQVKKKKAYGFNADYADPVYQ